MALLGAQEDQGLAEAAAESLAGPDRFGLTQPQRESIRQRLAEKDGEDKADTIEIADHAASSYNRNQCCQQRMLCVAGYRKPIEGFKRQKEHAVRRRVCTHCGTLGEHF